MAIEIVDLPMDSMVMSHSFWYVYQRVPVVVVAGDGPARVRLPRILRAKKKPSEETDTHAMGVRTEWVYSISDTYIYIYLYYIRITYFQISRKYSETI